MRIVGICRLHKLSDRCHCYVTLLVDTFPSRMPHTCTPVLSGTMLPTECIWVRQKRQVLSFPIFIFTCHVYGSAWKGT